MAATRGQVKKHETGGDDTAVLVTKSAHYGVKSFRALIHALMHGQAELDVELLLILRSEIFDKADCRFYTWLIVRQMLLALKKKTSSVLLHQRQFKHALDILRVLPLEDQDTIDEGEYLIDHHSNVQYLGPSDGLDGSGSDSESDDENGGSYAEHDSDEELANNNRKRSLPAVAALVGDRKKKLGELQ